MGRSDFVVYSRYTGANAASVTSYDSHDCRDGGEMYRSLPIGYGWFNHVLSGRGESARGDFFVPSPGAGIDIVMVDVEWTKLEVEVE